MSWFGKIFGNSATGLIGSVGSTAEVFLGNKAQREQGEHLESMAVHNQYAAEFQYRGRRSWWDSLIDGLNRLPRPLITFSVLAAFPFSVWMIFNFPSEYKLLVEALAIIPTGLWAMASVVIGFYFSGRMQVKAQDFKVNGSDMKIFNDSLSEYKASKSDEAVEETEATGNQTIDAFNKSKREPSV